jgi:outer membrane protein OmpA-like peptidoglycan-associated protein
MRKLMLMMALFASAMVYGQVAYEKAKVLDNVYAGVEAGVSTPLSFNSVFPLNTIAGIKVGKELTPIFGIEAEGQVFFNDNNVGRWTNTFVKGTNVNLNGTINLTNLFLGYKGSPRIFEVKTNTGLGWLHKWNSSNDLSAKTGIDFCFNLNQANAIILTPGVYWNLTETNKIQFNRNFAQFAVFASYVYRFKTSNGTHSFKVYDIGAMNDEINNLRNELAKKPKVVVKELIKVKTEYVNPTTYIFFAKNSTVLTPESRLALENIKGTVDIVAMSSPEGSKEYNQALSEKRAEVVADYLHNCGVGVNSAIGIGVNGENSNRVAIITSK